MLSSVGVNIFWVIFFIIQIDKSLKELLIQAIQTPDQQHYLSKLLGFNYEIQYKPGSTNIVDKALSHVPNSTSTNFLHPTIPQVLYLEELEQQLLINSTFFDLKEQCMQDSSTFVDGLLLHWGRIRINHSSRFKNSLLQEYHKTLIRGHARLSKTMKRLPEFFLGQHEARSPSFHLIIWCVSANQVFK